MTQLSSRTSGLDPFLAEILVCPRDKLPLKDEQHWMSCPNGHRYRVLEGVPILLLGEMSQTHVEGSRSLALADAGEAAPLPAYRLQPEEIDPFVREVIGATNGSMYQHLVGKLAEYPIPRLRLQKNDGELFLEIGCNWGRWCIAAAQLGYRPVGIDPSLKGILAARRVAMQLGVEAHYVVADGRNLPFLNGQFDQVFSYSVLQHLSPQDVVLTLPEIGRVLRPGGHCNVQMANAFGIRCLYHQARRGFRAARDFEVRYWTPSQLISTFCKTFGAVDISVDGYFSLNAQISDIRLLPGKYRALVRASESLRKISERLPWLISVADSLYVAAQKP